MGIARSNAGLAEALGRKKGKARRRYVEGYQSTEHRDDPASGSTVAALAADAARQGKEGQARFAEGFEGFIDALGAHLAKAMPGEADAATREQAMRGGRWNPPFPVGISTADPCHFWLAAIASFAAVSVLTSWTFAGSSGTSRKNALSSDSPPSLVM